MSENSNENGITLWEEVPVERNLAYKLFTKVGIDVSKLNLNDLVSNAKIIDSYKDQIVKFIYNEGDDGYSFFQDITRREAVKVIGDYGIRNLEAHYLKLLNDIKTTCLMVKENNLDAEEVFTLSGVLNFSRMPSECDSLFD